MSPLIAYGVYTLVASIRPDDAVSGKLDTRGTPSRAWKGWSKVGPPPAFAPFDSGQAKKFQEVWAEHLNVPVVFTNRLGMKFCIIPPGEFTMGNSDENPFANAEAFGILEFICTVGLIVPATIRCQPALTIVVATDSPFMSASIADSIFSNSDLPCSD